MSLKLFMLILGATPPGRKTGQHEIVFGIGASLRDLVPHINQSWEGAGKIHIDSWREVSNVDGYAITIRLKGDAGEVNSQGLFFLNLGGYKPNDMEEYHYKIVTVAKDKAGAINKSKKTAFFKHYGFKGAESHIDDKYGVDVDDIYLIEDILSDEFKTKYSIQISKDQNDLPDDINIPGYVKLASL